MDTIVCLRLLVYVPVAADVNPAHNSVISVSANSFIMTFRCDTSNVLRYENASSYEYDSRLMSSKRQTAPCFRLALRTCR